MQLLVIFDFVGFFFILDLTGRYYALEVSYFKSSMDRRLLESLWHKYWINTLSSSSLLAVSIPTYMSRNMKKCHFIKH